jgi:uncharacterized protein
MEDHAAAYVSARADTSDARAVFGPVMGLVALPLAFTALGAYIGRGLGETVAFAALIGGGVSLCLASGAEIRALTALFGGGLLIGLGLGPLITANLDAHPDAVWHAAATTGAVISTLGAAGWAIRRDLFAAYRALLLLLVALLVTGVIAALVSTPGGDLLYSIAGIVVFGGFAVVDFNRLRRAEVHDVVPLAAGIFLDVVNIFLYILDLLDSE